MNELSAILAGFSIVSCCILCLLYLLSLPQMHKTRQGKIACTALMLTLAAVQICHVLQFMNGTELLSSRLYIALLALIPITFYFFSRELLFHSEGATRLDVMHGGLLALCLILPLPLAPLAAFLAGCLYTAVIFRKVLRMRAHLNRFKFEKFFFGLFLAITPVALTLGLALPVLPQPIFYHAYAGCVSLAMLSVVSALLVFPELLSDVLLASETAYAKSKLGSVNVPDKRGQLERLMREDKFYENENLTIAMVAQELQLSIHQLSELVNSSFGLSFPRYIREQRVEAAKLMLVAEPNASVLSISMSNGFKSQSNFYAAFRELTGQSPAAFRKAALTS